MGSGDSLDAAGAEYDLRAAFSEDDRSGFPYPAARSACQPWRANAFGVRAPDDDGLVFDSVHEVVTSLTS